MKCSYTHSDQGRRNSVTGILSASNIFFDGLSSFYSLQFCAAADVLIRTSVMLSSSLAMVSRLFSLAFSIASSLTRTASILDTMLPIECSMRSTRRLNLKRISPMNKAVNSHSIALSLFFFFRQENLVRTCP